MRVGLPFPQKLETETPELNLTLAADGSGGPRLCGACLLLSAEFIGSTGAILEAPLQSGIVGYAPQCAMRVRGESVS